MTTAIHEYAPDIGPVIHPKPTRSRTRRWGTILAVRRGDVYVRSTACPESGWLVRATHATADGAGTALGGNR